MNPNTLQLHQRRAARREALGGDLTIDLGDDVVIKLPRELPIDVFAPFETLDVDLPMLLRRVLDAWKADEGRVTIVDVVVDMLVVSPNLPAELLGAFRNMVKTLFGEDGYASLVAFRLSPQDIGEITRFLTASYGADLGEASGPRESSDSAGPTSSPTSSTSTESTPDASSPTPETPTSSAPDA